jgi:hypothetical protein
MKFEQNCDETANKVLSFNEVKKMLKTFKHEWFVPLLFFSGIAYYISNSPRFTRLHKNTAKLHFHARQ